MHRDVCEHILIVKNESSHKDITVHNTYHKEPRLVGSKVHTYIVSILVAKGSIPGHS